MSYPSIKTICKRRGINPKKASTRQLGDALVEAFKTDLPLGVDFLHKLAHKAKRSGKRAIGKADPGSPLGKQIIRLCGADISRGLIERRVCHGMRIGFYNCCKVVIAPTRKALKLSMVEQIQSQDGTLDHADC